MPRPYQLALHIFRRDLRLHDNTALIAALTSAEQVIPCFIFDKRQIEQNAYKSDAALAFMARSLEELDGELQQKKSQLYYFYGIAEDIVAKLLDQLPIDAVFFNRDYTPFSCARDKKISDICKKKNRPCHIYADALLHEPELIHQINQKPYTVFTHFFKKASIFPVSSPSKNIHDNYYQKIISFTDNTPLKKLLLIPNTKYSIKGGRDEARELVKRIANLKNYAESRQIPAEFGTTKLSAHNKFGTISIRELYAAICKSFGPTHTLINELYWRDFFTHIGLHFPHVFGHAFNENYEHIAWDNNEKNFRQWCEGQTGFPIVDAGMRELNTTGYMHNRVRMITASFLVKDLHLDWRLGEQYFAQKLVDYDPAVNNGNWQWAASTGCDAQPYFRIFNPWLQQRKFDPECLYIKRWIPELSHIAPNIIHALDKNPIRLMTNYPDPMLDHKAAAIHAKSLYSRK